MRIIEVDLEIIKVYNDFLLSLLLFIFYIILLFISIYYSRLLLKIKFFTNSSNMLVLSSSCSHKIYDLDPCHIAITIFIQNLKLFIVFMKEISYFI